MNPGGPAVFLDKDGTLMEDIPYNSDPELFVFAPGVVVGLRELARAGFRFFVVSNQSGVGRGYFDFDALEPMKNRLLEMFQENGLCLERVTWCPHFSGGRNPEFGVDCHCRKPNPGMLLDAARDHHLSLKDSWMVGDRWSDVEAGQAAGCKTAWLSNELVPVGGTPPDLQGPSFLELARDMIRFSEEGTNRSV